jgi:hypothetical protein
MRCKATLRFSLVMAPGRPRPFSTGQISSYPSDNTRAPSYKLLEAAFMGDFIDIRRLDAEEDAEGVSGVWSPRRVA